MRCLAVELSDHGDARYYHTRHCSRQWAKDIYLADITSFSVEVSPSTITSLLNIAMDLYSFSIFSLLLLAVKIYAFTIPVNQSTTTNSLHENSTTNIPPINYECVNKATWFGTSGFSKQFNADCKQAFDVMDVADFLRYDGYTELEFLSTDATSSQPELDHLQTPRRYTYGRLKAIAFISAYLLIRVSPSQVPAHGQL